MTAVSTRSSPVSPHSSRIGYLPELDGVRGIAVLAVMAYHGSEWASGGFLGVDIFFALSGFFITSLLVRERLHKGTVSLGRFYLRRGLRLLPALCTMLAFYLAFAAALDVEQIGRHLADAGTTLAMGANIPRAMRIPRPVYLAPCWSLSLEEHFYLVWPPLLVWLCRRVKNPRSLATFIAVSALVAWAYRVVLLQQGVDPGRLYYLLDTRADGLLMGGALGVLYGAGVLRAGVSPLVGRLLSVATSAVAMAWSALLFTADFDDRINHLWLYALMTASTCVLIVSVVCLPHGLIGRVLGFGPLVRVGQISYGLYLWHYPIFLALARDAGLSMRWILLVGGPLSFTAAVASYRYIERPALKVKGRFR